MSYKTSYKRKLILAIVLLAAMNFESCTKYEDGPLVSLKTKTKRISQDWNLVSVDGDVPLQEIYDELGYGEVEVIDYDIEFEFQEDGDFDFKATYTIQYSYSSYYGGSYQDTYDFDMSLDGDWDFRSNKEEVEIDFDRSYYGAYYDQYDERTFTIKRLTSSELILEAENGSEWVFDN